MTNYVVDGRDVFLAAPLTGTMDAGQIRVYRLTHRDNTCFSLNSFSLLATVDVGAPTLVGNFDGIVMANCGCVFNKADLLPLYRRLRVYREIINEEGQIMVKLETPLALPSVEVVYIKCADVFRWSDYQGKDSFVPWQRYVFCSSNKVDDGYPNKSKVETDLKALLDSKVEEIAALRKQIEDKAVEIDNLSQRLKIAESAVGGSGDAAVVDHWKKKYTQLEKDNASVERRVSELNGELTSLRAENAKLKDDASKSEGKSDGRRVDIGLYKDMESRLQEEERRTREMRQEITRQEILVLSLEGQKEAVERRLATQVANVTNYTNLMGDQRREIAELKLTQGQLYNKIFALETKGTSTSSSSNLDTYKSRIAGLESDNRKLASDRDHFKNFWEILVRRNNDVEHMANQQVTHLNWLYRQDFVQGRVKLIVGERLRDISAILAKTREKA